MNENFQKRILEKIRKLRLLDDFFMTRFFEGNIECTELVLRIILNKSDLRVVKVETQATIKNLIGRGACLDVLAVDEDGKYYDIEVQRAKEGADFRRARFNSSMLDMVASKEGDEHKDIADTYVIFITEKDIFGLGQPIYVIRKYVEQSMQKIDDGTHEIYVNAAFVGDSPIGKLMADFRNRSYEGMNYELLKQRSKFLKEDEKGAEGMCAFSEELLAEGRAEGRIANAIDNIRSMLQKTTMTPQEAMEMLSISMADRPAILAAL